MQQFRCGVQTTRLVRGKGRLQLDFRDILPRHSHKIKQSIRRSVPFPQSSQHFAAAAWSLRIDRGFETFGCFPPVSFCGTKVALQLGGLGRSNKRYWDGRVQADCFAADVLARAKSSARSSAIWAIFSWTTQNHRSRIHRHLADRQPQHRVLPVLRYCWSRYNTLGQNRTYERVFRSLLDQCAERGIDSDGGKDFRIVIARIAICIFRAVKRLKSQ